MAAKSVEIELSGEFHASSHMFAHITGRRSQVFAECICAGWAQIFSANIQCMSGEKAAAGIEADICSERTGSEIGSATVMGSTIS